MRWAANPERLKLIGIGVIFVGALLAAMLSLPRLFDEDARDGSLELLLTSPEPLAVLILARVTALSLALGLALALVSPVFALFYALPGDVAAMLALTVAMAVPTLFWWARSRRHCWSRRAAAPSRPRCWCCR